MRVRRSALLFSLVTMLGLLSMVACGSDDDDDAERADDPTAQEAGSGESTAGDGGEGGGEEGGSQGSGSGSGALTCPDEAAVSEAVGVEVAADPPTADSCRYYDAGGSVSVGIVVEDPTSRTVEDIERNLAGVELVEGVGDGAYEVLMGGDIVQFGAFESGRHVVVTISGVDAPDVAIGRAVYDLIAA
jgi:hypothetical protein